MKSTTTGRLSEAERDGLERDGYVVRRGVFDAAEVAGISAECDALVEELVRDRTAHRFPVGSYVFDPDFERATMIKWEGDTDTVHGIEPFAHLRASLHAFALDARFVEPMRDLVGAEPDLFTEKYNLKRPRVGGVNPLHQDYPYWVGVAADPADVATAMLFLDDATLENGCLHVVPGSHKHGVWKGRTDGDQFLANEIDTTAYDDIDSVPLELDAGSVVMFGSYLAHRSEPNRSERERRAILFSYQPAGRAHILESMRKLGSRS